MRERIKNLDGPAVNYALTHYELGYSCNQQSIEPTEEPSISGSYVEFGETKVMHDVVTPNFRKRQCQGEIINNPMDSIHTTTGDHLIAYVYADSRRFWDVNCDPDQWTYYYDGYEGTRPSSDLLGDFDSLPAVPAYDPADDIATAVTRAWANVDMNSVQALVMTGEARKTVLSLAAIFKRLISVVTKIMRLDGHGLALELTPKQLSDRYMELRYALRPLMYDAQGTIGALTQTAADFASRLTFRGKTVYSDSDFVSTPYVKTYTSTYFGDRRYGYTLEESWQHLVNVRAGVLTQLEQYNALNTWGLLQPVESWWELVPFSFVIDWFINVGDTLASWTPHYGLKALASWYTVEDIVYQSRRAVNPWWQPASNTSVREHLDWKYWFSTAHVWRRIITKTRVPNPNRAITPTFTVRLNSFKFIDLVIILKQIMGGKR